MQYLLLFISGLISISAFSQSSPDGIRLLARPEGNQVVLRWAPVSPVLWQAGNRYGYKIERFTLRTDGTVAEPAAQGKLLSAEPIRPFSPQNFDLLAQKEEKAAIVQEMIYGSTPPGNLTGPAGILKRKQDAENRFGFALLLCDLSPQIAFAAGLQFTDKTVVPGSRYIYRVSLAGQPAGLEAEPAVVVVDVTEAKPLLPPDGLTARFEDKKVTLSWPIFLHKGIYTAYVIEKSTDGKSYQPLSDLPYVFFSEKHDPEQAFYVDSLASNETIYYYRIKGLTPFGETSPPSVHVKGIGKEQWAGLAVIEEARVLPGKQVVISWQFPAQYHPQIKGYYLTRSGKPDGPYKQVGTKLISPAQYTFTDTPPSSNTYYRLHVIDKAGEERAVSLPYLVQVEDNTPPSAPVGMQGNISSKGLASITWQPNGEADLLGYRVFKANKADEEFIEVTQHILPKPEYLDSVHIHTLTRKVYYKIVAVDRNYNPSAYSKALELQRPDVIPPAAAVFRQAEQ